MFSRPGALAGLLACALPVSALSLLSASPASGETVSGTGRAPIRKDADSVRATAMAEARRAIIIAMLTKTVGGDRLSEVPPETIARMAEQIRPDMLVDQSSERQDSTFVLHLTADIDGGWFRQMLADYAIDSASQRADGDRHLIFVMLDEVDGVASDYSQPAEVHIEYDRATGGSYSDQSSVKASSRSASASSSRSAGASSSRYAGAAHSSASGAYRGRGEAAAASARSSVAVSGSSAAAYNRRSASARSSASSYSDRTDVQAEVHDDVRYRAHIVYQRPPEGSDGDRIMSALKGTLGDYGVATADSWAALAAAFNGQPPRYAALKRDGRYPAFLAGLQARNAPMFMGGTYQVSHAGTDPATGQARCSGSLTVNAFITADGRDLGSDQVAATAAGMTPEDCSARLAQSLAGLAAQKTGPRIQNYWRTQARRVAGVDAGVLADYTLVLRAAHVDMAMQMDVLTALKAIAGVSETKFGPLSATEMRFTVRYSGDLPLQLALYQQLRDRPAYAAMDSVVEGRGILICLQGCGGRP